MAEGGGKHILVAEDSRDLALIAKAILTSAGHAVTVVSDADKVMPAVVLERPDLILLDVMMPSEEGLDGFEICRRLKASPRHEAIPVVMCSAIAEGTGKSAEQMRLSAGADAYLHKPYEAQQLLDVIQPLLADQ